MFDSLVMFLKVKSGEQFLIVEINDPESEEFTSSGIIISIVDNLNLELEGSEIHFKDRDGATIEFEKLPGIVRQYGCCSCFFVEICLEGAANKRSSITKELECYLKDGDYSNIFIEYREKQILSDSSRRCLVREAVNFLRQRRGNYPKREDKIALAEAIIHLFPAYKVENSNCGGIDLFFNPEANSGYLVAKLKNFNSKRRKLCPEITERKEKEVENSSDEELLSEEDLQYFQNCIVVEQLPTIKEKLRKTLKTRIKYCSAGVNVLETFPIFGFDSSLILFDFELRYGEIKANYLFDNWDKYKNFVGEIVDEAGGQNLQYFSDWTADILPFLNLLKLLLYIEHPFEGL